MREWSCCSQCERFNTLTFQKFKSFAYAGVMIPLAQNFTREVWYVPRKFTRKVSYLPRKFTRETWYLSHARHMITPAKRERYQPLRTRRGGALRVNPKTNYGLLIILKFVGKTLLFFLISKSNFWKIRYHIFEKIQNHIFEKLEITVSPPVRRVDLLWDLGFWKTK